jgi:hypothetical protein
MSSGFLVACTLPIPTGVTGVPATVVGFDFCAVLGRAVAAGAVGAAGVAGTAGVAVAVATAVSNFVSILPISRITPVGVNVNSYFAVSGFEPI